MTTHVEDEPLDPKVEAIRKKMVRLLLVSGAIMMIGLMTVLIAIVYKLNQSSAPTITQTGTISIPSRSKIVSTAVGDGKIMLTVRDTNGKINILIFDEAGNLISQLAVNEQ